MLGVDEVRTVWCKRVLSRALRVGGYIDLDPIGRCTVESAGWLTHGATLQGLECRYILDGRLVASLMIGLDPRARRTLHAVHLEVLAQWRGYGIGRLLLESVFEAAVGHFDRVDGHCDAIGRWAWLGVFDWDPVHRAQNARALQSVFLSPNPRALATGNSSSSSEVAAFLQEINSALNGAAQGIFRLDASGSGVTFIPGAYPTAEDACYAVLDRISTKQLKVLAATAGSAAKQLVMDKLEWHGVRVLP